MELLIVIAITGVLAALVLPILGKIRQSADKATCISNLRSLGLGLMSYAQDNQGQLPLSLNTDPLDPAAQISWQTLMQRELNVKFPIAGQRSIFYCPSARRTYSTTPYRTYGLNLAGGSPTAIPPRLTTLTSPTRTALLVETKHETGGAGYNAISGSISGVGGKSRLEARHSDLMNMLTADGGVRQIATDDPDIDDLLLNIRK